MSRVAQPVEILSQCSGRFWAIMVEINLRTPRFGGRERPNRRMRRQKRQMPDEVIIFCSV